MSIQILKIYLPVVYGTPLNRIGTIRYGTVYSKTNVNLP
jgi:hypothetical protein